MKGKFQNKMVNIFTFVSSCILLISSLFYFLNHVDYFSTRILTSTTALNLTLSEQDAKIGAIAKFSFIDRNRKEFITKEMFISEDFYEEIKHEKQIKIYYTKYFSQVLIKGYKNPRVLILLLDLIMISLFCIGIKAWLQPLKNVTTETS